MEKRSGAVTFAGGPVTLVGPEVKVGEKAPDFKLLDNSLAEKTLKDYEGKIKVISVVPSLDTGVCDAQTRWCGAAGVKNVVTLSDHRDASFGTNYGFLMEGLRLEARGVVVIDKNDKVTYVEYVPEVTHAINFDGVLAAVKALI